MRGSELEVYKWEELGVLRWKFINDRGGGGGAELGVYKWEKGCWAGSEGLGRRPATET